MGNGALPNGPKSPRPILILYLVICCETAIRLELGAKRKCQKRAQNVADDPTETLVGY